MCRDVAEHQVRLAAAEKLQAVKQVLGAGQSQGGSGEGEQAELLQHQLDAEKEQTSHLIGTFTLSAWNRVFVSVFNWGSGCSLCQG